MNQSNPERTGRAMTMREIREALGHNVNPQPPVDRAAWVDGDPLLEAIARAVWEQCSTEGTSLVVDDPRNIAAVAASVARAAAPAAVSPQTDRAALRDRIAAALYERERPPRDPHWPDAYAMDRETFEAMADAVLAVLPEQADRAAGLSDVERQFLTYALDLAADQMASRGDGFGDEDQAAMATLRRLAVEAQSCRLEHPHPGYQCEPRTAVEAHGTGTQQQGRPARGDQFEAWLKAQRDEYETRSSREWRALDEVLDTYRLHADTGTPLDRHVCEARVVGQCECLEPAPVAQQPAAEAWVCKCPAGLCGCGHHAPAEQQAAAADGEETPSRAVLLELVRDFLDADPCSFDHHGYCQAHGWLGGEPGSCPHGRARKLIPGIDEDAAP